MTFTTTHDTGLIGRLTLASDGESLTGCWFEKDRYGNYGADMDAVPDDSLEVFKRVHDWLDRYFAGKAPNPCDLPLNPAGSDYQKRVWKALAQIPYGQLVTYGDIAKAIALETGKGVSNQAVGGAVGRNPICVIVPCHRVVGAGGNLTGFGGGLAVKISLLEHEQVDMSKLHMPKKTADWDWTC